MSDSSNISLIFIMKLTRPDSVEEETKTNINSDDYEN
jgi:hypothetical protein